MAKHNVITTDAEIDRSIERAKDLQNEPRVTDVEYRPGPGLDLLILKLRAFRSQWLKNSVISSYFLYAVG
jgi:hypothetical protein